MLDLKVYSKNKKKQLHLVIPKKQLKDCIRQDIERIRIKDYELIYKKKKRLN